VKQGLTEKLQNKGYTSEHINYFSIHNYMALLGIKCLLVYLQVRVVTSIVSSLLAVSLFYNIVSDPNAT